MMYNVQVTKPKTDYPRKAKMAAVTQIVSKRVVLADVIARAV